MCLERHITNKNKTLMITDIYNYYTAELKTKPLKSGTQVDRIRIKDFLILGLSQTQIADKLKVHKSTISREIKRNSGLKGYRSKQAQRTAEQRQAFRSNLRKWTTALEKKSKSSVKEKMVTGTNILQT